jgi:hypothetical protein
MRSVTLVIEAPPAMVLNMEVKVEVDDVPPGFEVVATTAPRNQVDGAGARAAATSSHTNDPVSQTITASP